MSYTRALLELIRRCNHNPRLLRRATKLLGQLFDTDRSIRLDDNIDRAVTIARIRAIRELSLENAIEKHNTDPSIQNRGRRINSRTLIERYFADRENPRWVWNEVQVHQWVAAQLRTASEPAAASETPEEAESDKEAEFGRHTNLIFSICRRASLSPDETNQVWLRCWVAFSKSSSLNNALVKLAATQVKIDSSRAPLLETVSLDEIDEVALPDESDIDQERREKIILERVEKRLINCRSGAAVLIWMLGLKDRKEEAFFFGTSQPTYLACLRHGLQVIAQP